MLRTTTLTPMAHLICVAHSRLELAEILIDLRKDGVENLMALGGDPPTDPGAGAGELTHAIELVELARSIGGFSIGVAAHPAGHPGATDLDSDRDRLTETLRLAAFAATQFFFREDEYLSLVDDLAARGVDKRVRPGIMPITSAQSVPRMAQLGSVVPADVVATLERIGDPDGVRRAGIEMATRLRQDLLDAGAPGPALLHSQTIGALLLPYTRFLAAAEAHRYDIDLLCRRFGGRLRDRRPPAQQPATARGKGSAVLLRPGRPGRQHLQAAVRHRFQLSRVGGSCPLWNVYEAFAFPGQIRTQLAQVPHGRKYLWVARTVARSNGGYDAPAKTFASGLGCDLQHASRLVYTDTLDPTNPAAFVPIGPGCKLCQRESCPQRTFPAIGELLEVDPNRSRFTPYGVSARLPAAPR